MFMPKRLSAGLAVFFAAMFLVACSSSATVAPTPQVIRETVEVQVTSPPQIVEATVEVPVPADAGSLVVYSGRSEALVAPIIAQFAEATGIDVEVRYGSTAEIAATLLEEGTSSPADVFFAQDPGGVGAVSKEGLFAPLPSETLNLIPERFRSPEGTWTGVSGRARVVVYNTEALSPEDLPADIYDFINPEWSGRLGFAPGNGSFQTMVTAMRLTWGEEKTRAWLEGLKANQPALLENNNAVVQAAAAGEIDAGFVNHYYLYRFLKEEGEGFGARNQFLTGSGPGSLIMTASVGRLANGPNEENAIRFINFLLSPVAQQYFSGQTYEYPLVEGVNTQAGLPPLADLESAALNIDISTLDDVQGTTALIKEVGLLE